MGPKFKLGDRVRIACSGETGTVVGVAEYANGGWSALVRYKAADNRAVETWWAFDALDTSL